MLNIHILYDELSRFNPTLISTEKYDLTLKYTKIILNKEDFDKQKQILYVVKSSLFDEIFTAASSCHLIVIGDPKHSDEEIMRKR